MMKIAKQVQRLKKAKEVKTTDTNEEFLKWNRAISSVVGSDNPMNPKPAFQLSTTVSMELANLLRKIKPYIESFNDARKIVDKKYDTGPDVNYVVPDREKAQKFRDEMKDLYETEHTITTKRFHVDDFDNYEQPPADFFILLSALIDDGSKKEKKKPKTEAVGTVGK